MGDSQSKQFGDQYLGKLSDQLNAKAPVFGQSLFAGAGDATKNAWSAGTNAANDLIGRSGFNTPMLDAMKSFGDIGSGYGSLTGNGGLTQSQASSMWGMQDLGNKFAGLGGLTGGQTSAMAKTAGLGDAYGGLANAYDQNAPGYARMRQQMLDDAVKNVGAGFTQSGRFGGGSYINDATEASLNAIAPLDYQNYQNSVNNKYRALDSQKGIYDMYFNQGQQGRDNTMSALAAQGGALGNMFNMGQQGQANLFNALAGQQGAASALLNAGQLGVGNKQGAIDALSQIGAAQDANAQGKLLGKADLYDRTNNAELDRLIKIGAAFGGNGPGAAASEAPWWQQMLGYVVGNAGKAASGGAFGGGG